MLGVGGGGRVRGGFLLPEEYLCLRFRLEGLFSGGLIYLLIYFIDLFYFILIFFFLGGGAYYRNFTVLIVISYIASVGEYPPPPPTPVQVMSADYFDKPRVNSLTS